MLLNAKQLAEYLGITVRTVYSLMESGNLPPSAKFGGSRRWDSGKVKEWLDGLEIQGGKYERKRKADKKAGNKQTEQL